MNIFKTRTLDWYQVAAIKLAAISFALLVAHYWPIVVSWVAFWWVVFILMVIYALTFAFKK